MAFTVQDDTGTVDGANAYVSVADFQSYHSSRGNSLSGMDETDMQWAIVKATDYVDARFTYAGKKLAGRSQATQWPRAGVKDCGGYVVSGLPSEVVSATCEYALRALSTTLAPDPARSDSGRVVERERVKVGPVEEEYTYADGPSVTQPRYPAADNILINACFVTGGHGQQFSIVRG